MEKIKFKELRTLLSIADRISVCDKKTLQYENFITVKDVPDHYNDLYVCGIGIIESEFYKINECEYSTSGKQHNLVFLPCMEIIMTKLT